MLELKFMLLSTCAILLSPVPSICDSPPKLLRDPTFLKFLATHYPGTVLQPTRRPPQNTGPTGYHEHPHTQPESHIYQQEGWSDQSAQHFPESYASSTFGHKSAQNTSQTGPSAKGPEATSGPAAPMDDLRPVRWTPTTGYGYRPTYQRYPYQTDHLGSYSTQQQQYVRPAANYYKKQPVYYNNKKIVKISEAGSTKKYVKVNPNVYYTKPVAYKKTSYPVMYQYKYQKKVPYYRKPQYPYAYVVPSEPIRSKVKRPVGDLFASPPRNAGFKNTTAELHEFYQPTERTTEVYTERPLSQSSPSYYDTYDEATVDPHLEDYESATRGYYGNRLYMSTQSPDVGLRGSRPRVQFVEEDEDEMDTLFD